MVHLFIDYTTAGMIIGFVGAPYQVVEDRGPVIFTVTVIGGTALDRDVVVSFSTVDGSTPGG